MSSAAPLWPEWLRDELAARPGRWRQALVISGSAALALGVVLALQIASFPAPLIAFKALMPSIVCTWRNLFIRAVVIVAAALLVIPSVGVLVQVPWLLLPVFFAAVSALTYIAPLEQYPVRGYCAALTVGSMSYTAVFAPYELGTTALSLSGGFLVGLLVATTVAELRRADHPHDRLSHELATSFTNVRLRLRDAGARYRAASAEQPAGAAPPAPAPQPAGAGDLARRLQLFDLVRQEHRRPELERAFVALITAAERIELFVALAEMLARQPVARAYRALVDRELGALLDAIDFALARYAEAATQPESVLSADAAPATHAGPWPDFRALVAALRARQHAVVESGQIIAVDLEEAENLNAFTQAIDGLADVLDVPPEALEHVAPEPLPTRPPAFDPYVAQFAMKIGLGSTLALLIGVISHERALEPVVLSPLLLAQGSYGATLHKAGLRIAGVVIGGVIAALIVVAIMPNTTEPAVWMLVFFAVLLPSAYIAVGTPRLAYFGQQIAYTFMIVMVADRPVVDIHEALWRFFGTLLGTAVLLGVFQIVQPDYAGRQIISRFRDILRTLLTVVPELDRPIPPVAQTQRCGDEIVTALAAVLRLVEEARYEGHNSGIDRAAAVDAAGLMRRVAHRWALVRRSRRAARPPLPPALHGAIAALESALQEHLRMQLALLDARHHRARLRSTTHRAARAAAAAVAASPRPALEPLLRALEEAVAAARRESLRAWPAGAGGALIAEVGHLHRLVELTPALGASLERMSLPPEAATARGFAGALRPVVNAGSER